ncbi:MAG TPA: peptidoglycan editing factor PgeF [Burkholderiales bacterium]|nr:peptidoglycan editing factor PgeF [Burkholderiales bacterium]
MPPQIESPRDWIVPHWPAAATVRALITTRAGGSSRGPYKSLNLGNRVNDSADAVAANRAILRSLLPAEPAWLNQVHGTRVVEADAVTTPVEADASFTRSPGTVCTMLVADCLPVLLADRHGSVVAAVHAGWRGLAAGVIESAIAAMTCPPDQLIAYLGPAIGADAFEVGEDVRQAFLSHDSLARQAFRPHAPDKWLADLFLLARQRLAASGVSAVYGGGLCTFSDPQRFFSHRRDRVTGRMAALIWLAP